MAAANGLGFDAALRALPATHDLQLAILGSGRHDYEELFRRVAREQSAAILVVTHDEKIFDRFDRMVNLRDGRIESETRAA